MPLAYSMHMLFCHLPFSNFQLDENKATILEQLVEPIVLMQISYHVGLPLTFVTNCPSLSRLHTVTLLATLALSL